jgi:hypothetical protein
MSGGEEEDGPGELESEIAGIPLHNGEVQRFKAGIDLPGAQSQPQGSRRRPTCHKNNIVVIDKLKI